MFCNILIHDTTKFWISYTRFGFLDYIHENIGATNLYEAVAAQVLKGDEHFYGERGSAI